METLEIARCDNCLSPLDPKECVAYGHTLTCTLWRHRVERLPIPVATAPAGDPAVLCAACLCAVIECDEIQLHFLAEPGER